MALHIYFTQFTPADLLLCINRTSKNMTMVQLH